MRRGGSSGWEQELPPELGWVHTPRVAEVSAFCRRWLSRYRVAWPEQLLGIPERLVRDMDRLAGLSGGPRTLVHGDFHSQNVSFGDQCAGPATMIDFQFVQHAPAVYDVARFLATSVPTDIRRSMDQDLLRRYHDDLLGHGVQGYSFDECVDHFRAALVWNLATPLALHVIDIIEHGGHWPASLPILQRCVNAVVDWDAAVGL